MMGATAIVTSSSDAKLEKAKSLGADHTINYKTETRWGDAVQQWTGGRGVDHVLEIGGPGTLPQSITAARVGGHVALIGILTGIAGNVPTLMMMAKQIKLQGIIVGSRRHQQDMIRALDANPACDLSSTGRFRSKSWRMPSDTKRAPPTSARFAWRCKRLRGQIVGCQCSDVHDVGVLRAERADLHRVFEADE